MHQEELVRECSLTHTPYPVAIVAAQGQVESAVSKPTFQLTLFLRRLLDAREVEHAQSQAFRLQHSLDFVKCGSKLIHGPASGSPSRLDRAWRLRVGRLAELFEKTYCQNLRIDVIGTVLNLLLERCHLLFVNPVCLSGLLARLG